MQNTEPDPSTDSIDVGQPGTAPAIPTQTVAGKSGLNPMQTQAALAAQNSPDAIVKRQVAALAQTDPAAAMKMQAENLQSKAATIDIANKTWNNDLAKARAGGLDGLVKFMSDSAADGQGGQFKAKAVVSDDGKTFQIMALQPDGTVQPTKLPPLPNDSDGWDKLAYGLANVPIERRVAHAFAEKGAGIQKVGIAHEDTVFINVFRTDGTDIEKIEAEIATVPFESLCGPAQAEPSEDDLDRVRADYRLFLVEYGLTESQVQAIVADMSDHIELPEPHGLYVAESRIHGVGTFASREFNPGDVIATARLDGKRTSAGRRTNHSPDANCRFEKSATGDLLMVASQRIRQGCELTVDYRQAASANTELGLHPTKEPVCH
ncbi:MAG TPA: SET domain-containing protein [Burkholderiaceae bacterium]